MGDKLNITVDLTFHALSCAGKERQKETVVSCRFHAVWIETSVGCVYIYMYGSIHPYHSARTNHITQPTPLPQKTDVHVDAMDVAGDNQMKVEHNMLKQRLSAGTHPSTVDVSIDCLACCLSACLACLPTCLPACAPTTIISLPSAVSNHHPPNTNPHTPTTHSGEPHRAALPRGPHRLRLQEQGEEPQQHGRPHADGGGLPPQGLHARQQGRLGRHVAW